MGNHKKSQAGWVENLESEASPKENRIPITLIIPTHNNFDALDSTLKSVLAQEYPLLEIIVVDAGSTDRTLEIVHSYDKYIKRIYTVTQFHFSDMLDRGISLVTDDAYLSFLFPGSFYTSDHVFQIFAEKIVLNQYPDLIYCGSTQRWIGKESKTVNYPFESNLLKKGISPATLPACWFRTHLFQKIGRFNLDYLMQPGFDFFCRCSKASEVRIVYLDRVYVDTDYGHFSYKKALRYYYETWIILKKHFGLLAAFRWFLKLNHRVMLKDLWNYLKQIIFDRRVG